MKWIVDNWSFLVVVLAALCVTGVYVKKFLNKPTTEQLNKIRQWLLWAVIEAEKNLGGGTGVLKLRYVYDLFIKQFPNMVDIISFEFFSQLVDEVLTQMKHLLETNYDIASYVGLIEDEGEEDVEAE